MIDTKTLNRIRRVLGEIKSTAERAKGANGNWHVSHDHVIGIDHKGELYDVASRPHEAKHAVYGVYKYGDVRHGDIARHISACNPARMLRLCEDIEKLIGSIPSDEASGD